jgi:hypothetical protein
MDRQAIVDKMISECRRDAKGRPVVPDDFFNEYFDILPPMTFNESGEFRNQTGARLKPWKKGESTEAQRMGGRASQAILKEKRTFAEVIKVVLDTEDPKTGRTVREDVVNALVAKAMDGCVGAFEAIRDTAGEKPTESLNVDVMTDADRELMKNLMSRINNDGD